MPSKTSPSHEPETGFVRGDCLYTLAEASRRLALGQHAMRMARRKGLRVHYVSGRGFIHGADLIAYICGPHDQQ